MGALETGVGRRIRQALEEKEMSAADLAEAVGVSTAAVSYWCGGKRRMNICHLDRVANVLGVSPTWLLQGLPAHINGLRVLEASVEYSRTQLSAFRGHGEADVFQRSIERRMAESIARELIEKGHVSLREEDIPAYETRRVTGQVVLASNSDRDHVSERLTEAAQGARRDVVNRLAADIRWRISIWGRDFGWQDISKKDAGRFIDEAVKKVLEANGNG